MNKKVTRAETLSKRNRLSESQVEENSTKIMTTLESQQVFQEAKNILFYFSHGKEVKTIRTLEQWMKKKEIYLPKLVDEAQMEAFFCEDLSDFELNKYGIPEPKAHRKVMEAIELILVPGVAFDLKGNRIGMGKGYYDRFLARHKDAFKIALAYEIQIFDELPKELYDESVDMIITEKRIINCLPKIDD